MSKKERPKPTKEQLTAIRAKHEEVMAQIEELIGPRGTD